ncbi:MAG TPA: hypothetical protein VNI84_19135 [Pyrinomonadaceae bacterium]|nr:hypothetical protein [Pyrinomonadaceae bacterium]
MKIDKIEIFRQTELFRDLDAGVLRVLAVRAVEKHLERGGFFFSPAMKRKVYT